MVIDLSHLNTHIPCPSFKMMDTTKLRSALPHTFWLTSVDLSDAFFHIPVNRRFQKFLSFSHQGSLYRFTATPFGLNISPRLFTRFSRFPLALLHAEGVTTSAYLDDWIIWAPSHALCLAHTGKVVRTLQDLGFRINFEKSHLLPTQELTYLGTVWNGRDATVAPSPKNVRKALELLTQGRRAHIALLTFQQLVGQLNFLRPLVPGLVSLFSLLCLLAPRWKSRSPSSKKPTSPRFRLALLKDQTLPHPGSAGPIEASSCLSPHLDGRLGRRLGSHHGSLHNGETMEADSTPPSYHCEGNAGGTARSSFVQTFAADLSARLHRLTRHGFVHSSARVEDFTDSHEPWNPNFRLASPSPSPSDSFSRSGPPEYVGRQPLS